MRVGITQKHNTNMHSYLTEKEINQINFKGRKTGFKNIDFPSSLIDRLALNLLVLG